MPSEAQIEAAAKALARAEDDLRRSRNAMDASTFSGRGRTDDALARVALARSVLAAGRAALSAAERQGDDDLRHLLECVDVHADKFPVPSRMRAMVTRIRQSMRHLPAPPTKGD